MKNTTSQIDAALLLEQTGWLRALAWNLVGDAHRAEELTQDTLLTALDRPPRRASEGVALRAWLAKVARNLARGAHRGERRRAERELATARSERLPSVDEAVERTELRRRLVEAILELRTPYREVVILRHLEGLTNAEIAERTGATPQTVRTRLSRGLAMLRERLDAEYGGDRRAWLAVCLPLARELEGAAGAAAASSSGAVAAAGWSWWPPLVSVVLALAAIAAIVVSLQKPERLVVETAGLPLQPPVTAPQEPGGERAAAAAAAATTSQDGGAASEGARRVEVEVDEPRAAPARASAPFECRLVLRPDDPAYANAERFPSPGKGEPTVALGPARRFSLEDAREAQDSYGFPSVQLRIAASDRQAFGDWTEAGIDQQLAVLVAGEVRAVATITSRLPQAFLIEGGPTGFSEEEVEEILVALGFPPPVLTSYASVLLVVDARTGAPLPQATVHPKDGEALPVGDDGRFASVVEAAEEDLVRVEAPGFSPVAVALLRGHDGPGHAQRVELEPWAELRLTVLDAAGEPVEGALVLLRAQSLGNRVRPRWLGEEFANPWAGGRQLGLDDPWRPIAGETDREGRVSFEELMSDSGYGLAVHEPLQPGDPREAHREALLEVAGLTLPAADDPALVSRTLLVGPGETRELRVRLPERVALQGSVVGPDGAPLAGVPVQALRVDEPRQVHGPVQLPDVEGVPATRTDAQGRFRIEGLPPAAYLVSVPYEIRIGAPGRRLLAGKAVLVEDPSATVSRPVVVALAEALSIEGRLVDADGRPIARRTVHLHRGEPGALLDEARTDRDGRFRFHGLGPGTCRLSTSVSALFEGFGHAVEAGVTDALLEHVPCSVRVRVAGVSDLDAEHVLVDVIARGAGPTPASHRLQRSEAGVVHADELPPGTYDVVARSRDGRIGVVEGVELGREQRAVEPTVRLREAVVLTIGNSETGEPSRFRVRLGPAVVACGWLQRSEVRTLLVPGGALRIERFGAGGELVEQRSVEAPEGGNARVELGP